MRSIAKRNASRYRRETGKIWDPNLIFDLQQAAKETLSCGDGRTCPRFYIHMGNIEKVGVNLSPSYGDTPLGVYGFPLDEYYLNKLLKGKLPYQPGASFVSILELRQPESLLLVGEQNYVRAYKDQLDVKKKGTTSSAFAAFQAKNAAVPTAGIVEAYKKWTGADGDEEDEDPDVDPDFMEEGTLLLEDEDDSVKDRERAALLRRLILADGYTSAYDPGNGFIHPNEPTQIVFMTPKSYKVVAQFLNATFRTKEREESFYDSLYSEEKEVEARASSTFRVLMGLAKRITEATVGSGFLVFNQASTVLAALGDGHRHTTFTGRTSSPKLADLYLSDPGKRRIRQVGYLSAFTIDGTVLVELMLSQENLTEYKNFDNAALIRLLGSVSTLAEAVKPEDGYEVDAILADDPAMRSRVPLVTTSVVALGSRGQPTQGLTMKPIIVKVGDPSIYVPINLKSTYARPRKAAKKGSKKGTKAKVAKEAKIAKAAKDLLAALHKTPPAKTNPSEWIHTTYKTPENRRCPLHNEIVLKGAEFTHAEKEIRLRYPVMCSACLDGMPKQEGVEYLLPSIDQLAVLADRADELGIPTIYEPIRAPQGISIRRVGSVKARIALGKPLLYHVGSPPEFVVSAYKESGRGAVTAACQAQFLAAAKVWKFWKTQGLVDRIARVNQGQGQLQPALGTRCFSCGDTYPDYLKLTWGRSIACCDKDACQAKLQRRVGGKFRKGTIQEELLENPRKSDTHRILYNIGMKPPRPYPMERDHISSRPRPSSGVFLTPDWKQVAEHHRVMGHVYAVRVPRGVIRQAGGIVRFDGASEVIIPGELWNQIEFIGKVADLREVARVANQRGETAERRSSRKGYDNMASQLANAKTAKEQARIKATMSYMIERDPSDPNFYVPRPSGRKKGNRSRKSLSRWTRKLVMARKQARKNPDLIPVVRIHTTSTNLPLVKTWLGDTTTSQQRNVLTVYATKDQLGSPSGDYEEYEKFSRYRGWVNRLKEYLGEIKATVEVLTPFKLNPKQARQNPKPVDVKLYVQILAYLKAIHWLSWTLHWQASGPNFYGIHLMLERLYTGKKGGPDVQESMDQLGERIVSYFGEGAISPTSLEMASAQLIKLAQGSESNGLKQLLMLEDGCRTAVKLAWDQEQKAGEDRSLGLDDWLMGLSNERDTAIYLLERATRREKIHEFPHSS